MFEPETVDGYFAAHINEIAAGYNKIKPFFDLIDNAIIRAQFLSPFNALMVEIMRPGSSFAMTESEWAKHGRRKVPFSPPLLVLKAFGPVMPVYEYSDTEPIEDYEGEVLDVTPSFDFVTATEDPSRHIAALLSHAHYVSIDVNGVDMGTNLGGDTRRLDRGTRIVQRQRSEWHFKLNFLVRYDRNAQSASMFHTLVHEYAHVLLGHLGPLSDRKPRNQWDKQARDRASIPNGVCEIEAETVAYLVDKYVGVKGNGKEYLEPYLRQLGKEGKNWLDDFSITRVETAVKDIVDLLGPESKIHKPDGIWSSHPLGTGGGTAPMAQPPSEATLFQSACTRLFSRVR